MKQIECIIMDWAGTAVDFGCFAPVHAFAEAFNEIGIHVTMEEIRQPMGKAKVEHIRTILEMEPVRKQFTDTFGREFSEQDIVNINSSFEKHLFSTLQDYTDPIPYVIETLQSLRNIGIKIGSTTGYTRKMMDVVQPAAERKGYLVDCCMTPGDVPAGRPFPYMIYKNMMELRIPAIDRVVKVGDTMEDIKEGVNAKAWTVGVVTGSSELGLSLTDMKEIAPEQLTIRKEQVRRRMFEAGAHFVIDTLAELPAIIEKLNTEINK